MDSEYENSEYESEYDNQNTIQQPIQQQWSFPFKLGMDESVVKDYVIGTVLGTSAEAHITVTTNRLIMYAIESTSDFLKKSYLFYINEMRIKDVAGINAKIGSVKERNIGLIIGGILLLVISLISLGYFLNFYVYSPIYAIASVILCIIGVVMLVSGIFGSSTYEFYVTIKASGIYGGSIRFGGGLTIKSLDRRYYADWGYIPIAPSEDIYRTILELGALVSDVQNKNNDEEIEL